jgi:uncharacterized PurR-regulated membrane protein YhhQ (DUF165 family)
MRFLYLLMIAGANLLTAMFDPIPLAGGALLIPVGSLFAGATFIMRDFVQVKHGREKTYVAILWASALSGVLCVALGDTGHVAAASVAAFFVSESVDTEIFSRLRSSFPVKVLASGGVGGCLDSVVFVVLGLSPLGADMLPWAAVPSAILGQALTKTIVQAVGAGGILLLHRKSNFYMKD